METRQTPRASSSAVGLTASDALQIPFCREMEAEIEESSSSSSRPAEEEKDAGSFSTAEENLERQSAADVAEEAEDAVPPCVTSTLS